MSLGDDADNRAILMVIYREPVIARHCFTCSVCIKVFNPHNNPMRWTTKCYSHFTDEATEAEIKDLAKGTR